MTKAPARERLLDAADLLFYKDGIHTVGIDRIIDQADVAKATLYSTFGSKNELIRAYLQRRQDLWHARVSEALARFDDPRERLLGVFDVLAETIERSEFRGCAFINASAEAHGGGVVEEASDTARASRKSFFRELAVAAGLDDPDTAAEQVTVLYDGAVVGGRMDRDSSAARLARSIVERLI